MPGKRSRERDTGGKTLRTEPAPGKGSVRTADNDVLAKAASLAGIASSAVTVLGFAQTLRSGDGLWVLSGLGTAIFFLYAAWRRRGVAMTASALLLAVVAGQIGATGRFDLYHDAGGVMSDVIRTPDGMYDYPAGSSPDSAYAICSDYTSPNPSYNAYETSAGLETGNAFCFRTTEGKLAWATIEAVQPGSYTAVLQVRIWQ